MIVLLTTLLAHADCTQATTAADLSQQLTAAEAAYTSLDLPGFESSFTQALLTLPCLREPLSRIDAAALHRLQAMEHYVHQDTDAAEAALRSVIAIHPGALPSSTIAPPGNPLHDLILQAQEAGPGPEENLPPPAEGSLLVDGSPASRYPTARPWVLQILQDDGSVTTTSYLTVGQALPQWSVAAVPARGARALLLSGGALAVIGGGMYGAALVRSTRYRDLDSGIATTAAELSTYRSTTNTLVILSAGVAGAGTLLGGVGLALGGRW